VGSRWRAHGGHQGDGGRDLGHRAENIASDAAQSAHQVPLHDERAGQAGDDG